MKIVDQTMPEAGGRWAFDADVTAAFDDMLARSIPQYDVMRRLCLDLGSAFVQRGTDVIDLGCSRGEALSPFVDRFGAYNRFIGCDVSGPMLDAARERFSGYERTGVVRVIDHDLRKGPPPARPSLTLCVLTLQFTPIEYRHRIVQACYDQTVSGGAMILVEKVLGNDAKTDGAFTDLYLGMKAENGYTAEQIDRKRASLEGVLVPVTARWNEELLHSAGFARVECFWRWLNFAGWIAVKP